jgi:hypothetical protein
MRSLLRHPPRSLAALCAAVASLGLAACGGSAAGQAAIRTQQEEAKQLNFIKCLREHGVNVSTSGGSSGPIRVNATNPQTMEAAQKACQRYQPSGGRPNLTPQERVAREEAVQKFAKCMRQHGIKVETTTAGGGVAIRIRSSRGGGGSSGGPNPESPAFQAAQKACQGLLPAPPGGGKGGGPTTSLAPKSGGGPGPAAGFRVGG